VRPQTIVRTLAAAALLLVPTVALAAPDQNTNPNYNNNGCPSGQYRNGSGQCVNGNWNNNGQYNNGRNRHRDRDDNNNGRDRDDQRNNGCPNGQWRNGNGQCGNWNNGGYNNGGYYNNGAYNNGGYYGNGGYNNGRYGNRGNQLTGSVSSFSPYNLYLSNGTHVELHNGTVINPTGTNLTAGQRVRVIGNWNGDGTFNANEIDVVGNGRYRY
jgi:Domain of unknown function (DUF5666)